MRSGRWLRLLRYALVVTVVTVVAAELLLRGAGAFMIWRSRSALDYDPDGITILAIGESTTSGVWLPPEHSYPAQLEARLREQLGDESVHVVVPQFIGQNSSQQLNRLPMHLEACDPKIVLLMCGVNNTWSLAESNIMDFVDDSDPQTRALRMRLVLDRSRLFKAVRMGMTDLRFVIDDLAGRPEYEKWPPPTSSVDWARTHRPAFIELWYHDLGRMIELSRESSATPILLTYPTYKFPRIKHFEKLAADHNVALIRNDLRFEQVIDRGEQQRYLLEDGYHPTREGYGLIADAVCDHIIDEGLLQRDPGRSGPGTHSGIARE
jgi:lysophospholipase L1-like esterase